MKNTLAICVLSLALTTALFAFSSRANATASVCDAAPGNLATNCGFETGDFTGWQASPLDIFPDAVFPNSGTYAALAFNTSQLDQSISTNVGDTYLVSFYLASPLVPVCGDCGIQNVYVTGPHVLNVPDVNDLTVTFGGGFNDAEIANLVNTNYVFYQFAETATSNSTDLRFSFDQGVDPSLGTSFLYLDDVVVTDIGNSSPFFTTDLRDFPFTIVVNVPEPLTNSVFGAGLLGLVILRRAGTRGRRRY